MTPSSFRRHSFEVAQHTLEHVRVVVDAKLIRNCEQKCVRRRDRLVFCEFLDELIWLSGVGFAESGRAAVQVTDLVLAACRVTEVGAVQVADHRGDAAAYRDSRLTCVAGGLLGVTEPLDLLGLELVERDTGVLSE
jgi:hypothetical protein